MFQLLLILLTYLALATVRSGYASVGNILINTATAPSPPFSIELGEQVNLYFGHVSFSGGTVQLYLSKNGYSSITVPDDQEFGPEFSVAIIQTDAIDNTTYPGYSVGKNWINGTLPKTLMVPEGCHYIKGFDGTTSVASTDGCLNVASSFEIVPRYGPGGASIELIGYALPANDYVSLSYNDGGGWTTIIDLYPVGENGMLSYAFAVPDFAMALPNGTRFEAYSNITFRLTVYSTGQSFTDVFNEYQRGLKQVCSPDSTNILAPEGWLFGNETNFVSYGLYVKVKGDLIVAGRWFSPGIVTIMWDNVTLMGNVTTDEKGFFNTTLVVPITSQGFHNVVIEDATIKFVFTVDCAPLVDMVAPTAAAGPDLAIDEDTIVTFDGSSSTDNIGIASYTWTFRDITTQVLSGVSPSYNFTNPGVYRVTLKVTDVAGNWGTDQLTVTVFDVTAPFADAGPDLTVAEDTVVTFDGSSSSDNVGISSYVWTFEDGTTSRNVITSHFFPEPGIYTIMLNVTDSSGNWAIDDVIVIVLDVTKPVADAGFSLTAIEGVAVGFNASLSRDNVGVVSYVWNFGDGTNETGLAVNHTYTRSGNYTVVLTVTDLAGNNGTASIAVTVLADTDRDGIADIYDSDDDGDGIPDMWETLNGLNPLDADDALRDNDWDGVSNLQEYLQGSNPNDFFSPFNMWFVVIIAISLAFVAILIYLTNVKTEVSKEEFVEKEIEEFTQQFLDIKETNPAFYEWKVDEIRHEAEEHYDQLKQKGYVIVTETQMQVRLAKELKKILRKLSRR
jgi:PKD repeat protein